MLQVVVRQMRVTCSRRACSGGKGTCRCGIGQCVPECRTLFFCAALLLADARETLFGGFRWVCESPAQLRGVVFARQRMGVGA